MFISRVFLLVAAVCVGFALWNVRVYPTATYTSYAGVAHARCINVWDVWTDSRSPAPVPESQDILNATGPTNEQLANSACAGALVGHEHLSETWFAGAVLALILAFFAYRQGWLNVDEDYYKTGVQ